MVYDTACGTVYCLEGHCPKGQVASATFCPVADTHADISIRAAGCYFFPEAWVWRPIMKRSTIGLTIALAAFWVSPQCAGAELRPRSILVLDQSEPRGPFYFQSFTGIRAELRAENQTEGGAVFHLSLPLAVP